MLSLWLSRSNPRQSVGRASIFFACAIVPVVIAFILLAHAAGTATALHGLAGSWPWVGDQRLMQLPYFRILLGTDDVAHNLLIMGQWSLVYGGLVALAWLIARLEPKRALLVAIVTAIPLGVLVFAAAPWINWQNFLRPLPLLLLIALVWLLGSLWRCRSEMPVRRVLLLRVLTDSFRRPDARQDGA